jgi:predicted DNA-binding transcriptional regulator YafY
MPQRYAVRVRVAVAPAELAASVGRWGTVSEDGAGCVLEMNVDDLDWPVMVLAGSGADFVVESPPELAERVAEVGARFSRVG